MNNTTIVLLSKQNEIDDPIGAIIFISVVLIWYSLGIVFLMRMSNNEVTDYSNKIVHENRQREILRELVDKQKRDKLWDIYLGTSKDMNEKMTRADRLRIRNIEKQLSLIGQNNGENDYDTNLWSSEKDISSLHPPVRVRRRLSVDYRILQEWQMLADELKAHENWPWGIQKYFIRRHLRRHRQNTVC